MKCGYSAVTGADVALAAATAKTVLGIKAHANSGCDLQYASVSFAGVTPTAVPGLVELCYCTWATKSPGTNSTSVTPTQLYGRVIAVGATAARDWAAGNEPTALTVLDEKIVTPYAGLVVEFEPFGQTWDCAVSEGFAIRCTFAAIVNLRASVRWERC